MYILRYLPMTRWSWLETNNDIEYMMQKLGDTYKANGLIINCKKTKYLVVGIGVANDSQIDVNTIEKCEEYKYLGSIISSKANSKKKNKLIA